MGRTHLRLQAKSVKRASTRKFTKATTQAVKGVKLPGSTSFICSWSCSASPCNCSTWQPGQDVSQPASQLAETARTPQMGSGRLPRHRR